MSFLDLFLTKLLRCAFPCVNQHPCICIFTNRSRSGQWMSAKLAAGKGFPFPTRILCSSKMPPCFFLRTPDCPWLSIQVMLPTGNPLRPKPFRSGKKTDTPAALPCQCVRFFYNNISTADTLTSRESFPRSPASYPYRKRFCAKPPRCGYPRSPAALSTPKALRAHPPVQSHPCCHTWHQSPT